MRARHHRHASTGWQGSQSRRDWAHYLGLGQSNITLALGVYPVGAWIFNQRYPAGPWWVQVAWFLFGDVALLAVEGLLLVSGRMHYYHGWTFPLSAAVNLLLLALLRAHHVAVERPPERPLQPRGLRL